MRAHKLYFAFWFPITILCMMAVGSFIHILVNIPPYAREGMEALGGIPILLALGAHLPLVIGFVLCVIFHPRLNALRKTVVIPTVLMTAAIAVAVPYIPRKAKRTYDVQCEFVDAQGRKVPELTVRYTLETPQFLRLKDYTSPTPKKVIVHGGDLTVTKKRDEQLKLELEGPDFYYLDVNVPQWISNVPDYIHKVDFWWRLDKTLQTRSDSMSTSVNWRPIHDGILRIVMIHHGESLKSPYPPYTEESIEELRTNKTE